MSIMTTEAPHANGTSRKETFEFDVVDVTGMNTALVSDVQRTTPAGAVAKTLAARMELPQNVPWALRSDETAAYLDDSRAIGDQIETGARVVLTPKSHLGMR
jgi:hypothetical protein